MPQPIIVGVDGTSDSLLAADWAAHEARRQEAPLVLLYGYERFGFGEEGYEDEEARNLLDSSLTWVREHHDGIEVKAELAIQPESELLVERGNDAQMIVLGSRFYWGPVTGFVLGSVGHRVLSQAACPVVLIRGGTASRFYCRTPKSWWASPRTRKKPMRFWSSPSGPPPHAAPHCGLHAPGSCPSSSPASPPRGSCRKNEKAWRRPSKVVCSTVWNPGAGPTPRSR